MTALWYFATMGKLRKMEVKLATHKTDSFDKMSAYLVAVIQLFKYGCI